MTVSGLSGKKTNYNNNNYQTGFIIESLGYKKIAGIKIGHFFHQQSLFSF